ncbi:ArsC/Spx/MgsR family protein [Bacillus mexicanus]|uniref:ArsC/Spx/MgsR family protein n=1 Tax=Bacillus mexicanus TaxID=2834415 RepID=UPI003D1A9020
MKTAKLYVNTSCTSSRKAVDYFKKNNIPFREIKLTNETISKEDLELIMESSDGFEDLIKSTKLNDILDMSTNQCKEYIIENPTILRTPVIVQGLKTYIGFNDDALGMFLNREQKTREYRRLVSAIAI